MDITFVFLGFSILLASSAQLLIKKGALMLSEIKPSIADLPNFIFQIAKNFYIISGLACLGLSFFLWIFIVSKKQLNIVYPINSSLSIVFVAFFSWILFKENLSFYQLLGIATIILGIFFLFIKA
jgi:multidrug transporter EmrE-like cation transporter